jgi:hypothetical protein
MDAARSRHATPAAVLCDGADRDPAQRNREKRLLYATYPKMLHFINVFRPPPYSSLPPPDLLKTRPPPPPHKSHPLQPHAKHIGSNAQKHAAGGET